MDEKIAFLKSNLERAQYFAQTWEELLAQYPQLSALRSQEQWDEFSREHTGLNLDKNLWVYGPASLDDEIQELIQQQSEEELVNERQQRDQKQKQQEAGLHPISGYLGIHSSDDKEIPLINASIAVVDISGKKKVQTLLTDSRGYFKTNPLLPFKKYLLQFKHPDLGPEEKKRVVNMKAFQPPLRAIFSFEEKPKEEKKKGDIDNTQISEEIAPPIIPVETGASALQSTNTSSPVPNPDVIPFTERAGFQPEETPNKASTSEAVTTPQPTKPEATLMKKAESDLQEQWKNRYQTIENEINQKKWQELEAKYGDEQIVIPETGATIQKAKYLFDEFRLGKQQHVESGLAFETPLQQIAKEIFKKQTGREWTHERKINPTGTKIVVIPSHVTLLHNEVVQKARELQNITSIKSTSQPSNTSTKEVPPSEEPIEKEFSSFSTSGIPEQEIAKEDFLQEQDYSRPLPSSSTQQQEEKKQTRQQPSQQSLRKIFQEAKQPLSQNNPPSRPSFRNPLSRLRGGRRGAGKLAGRGASSLGKAGGKFLAQTAVRLSVSNPIVLIVILVIILLFLLFAAVLIILLRGSGMDENASVTLTKTGPAEVANGQEINYTLNVSYTNASQVIVKDVLPQNTEFVTASGPGNPTYDSTTRTVTWTLSGLGGSATGSGSANLGENLPPNADTCGGKYNLSTNNYDQQNYGDPGCVLANSPRVSYSFQGKSWNNVPQALIDLLQQLDPQNTGYWVGIISCEAPGFDPNNVTFFVGNTPTPDSGGAWGLFQMGRATAGPYKEGNGLNGQYDRGDVNWQNQVSNAINYNKALNGSWRYWACASDVWGLW